MRDLLGEFLQESEAVAEEANMFDSDIISLDLVHFEGFLLEDHLFSGCVVVFNELIYFSVEVGHDELNELALSN